MNIVISERADGNIRIYPYWDEIKNMSNVFPEKLILKIDKDKKYYSSKDQIKRYFIEGNDISIINFGEKKEIDLESVRQFISIAYSIAKKEFFRNINIFLFPDEWGINKKDIFNAAFESLMLSDYRYKGFKSKKEEVFHIEKVVLVISDPIEDVEEIFKKNSIICKSIFFTRDLVNGPANVVTIDYIENICKTLAKNDKLDIKILNKSELKKEGMNLLIAVGEGANQEPRLIELKYNAGKDLPTVCLIGKGIVFDTGGVNLKPGNALDDMKSDMAGAATVLGIIDTAANLKIPVNLIVVIPLAENSIGSNSYRPGDVVIGYNKKSVEIKNTDAEGRLILADALSYSDKKNPDIIIDFATLTGSAVVALGTKIVAGFFRDASIRDKIISCSKKTGETIWELPLFEEYKELLKNDIADLSNIGNPPREAGTIIAALFLSEFVINKKWVHFDIAGPAFIDKESYYNPKGATGVMIRTIVNFFEKL